MKTGVDLAATGGLGPSTVAFIKRFDMYPKLLDDHTVKTSSGATVTLVTMLLMTLLFLSEFSNYMQLQVKETMVIDTSLDQKLRINFDMTFHSISCSGASIDAMDVAGDQQLGLDHDVFKTRLHANGTEIHPPFKHQMHRNESDLNATRLPDDYCGHCYGARPVTVCCNTCRSVRDGYNEKGWALGEVLEKAEQCKREQKNPEQAAEKGEGCRLHGIMLVNKVAGNFHMALGEAVNRDGRHIHQFEPNEAITFDTSHTINHLSFGIDYPGRINALDESRNVLGEGRAVGQWTAGVYQYYVKIVPTTYESVGGEATHSFQYSTTQQFTGIELDFFGQVGTHYRCMCTALNYRRHSTLLPLHVHSTLLLLHALPLMRYLELFLLGARAPRGLFRV
jgi:hypothetical protein